MPLTTVQSGMMDSIAQYNGFKNRIINGSMVIDQRNNGASGTSIAPGYPVDRWGFNSNQTSKFTWQQNAGSVTPPTGFTKYLGFTSSSAYTVTGNDYFQFYQVIEGFNVADFDWGSSSATPATLSFWVRSSLTGTFGGSIATIKTAVWVMPFTYTISSANTWTYITVAITAPTSTGGANTDNTAGVYVRFGLGAAGTSVGGTVGVWTNAGNYIQPSGTVNVAGTNGATFYITGVQLEKGSTATAFDYRPYTTELQLCQRYFETGQIIRYGGATNASQGAELSQTFLVSKRIAPTISFASTFFSSSVIALSASNITVSGFVAVFNTSATGFGVGQGTITASAEL